MTLVDLLEEHRVTLADVPLPELRQYSFKDEPSLLRGHIAYVMVREWLKRIPPLSFEVPSANGYRLEQTNEGIVVWEGKRTVHEYDFLLRYEDVPYIVEVKSLKLNGFIGKIDHALEIGREIFQQDVGMLIFAPFYTNKKRDAERIEEKYQRVKCIDLGYKKKQLMKMTTRVFLK
ncbi:hypothetical protein HZB02_03955 [Candidatus Woesearchaeota archaeon]|nr:hypothetical protein [Candidatus Woesearchaeota archaeon]